MNSASLDMAGLCIKHFRSESGEGDRERQRVQVATAFQGPKKSVAFAWWAKEKLLSEGSRRVPADGIAVRTSSFMCRARALISHNILILFHTTKSGILQMDANGCKWMQMDANGCKWMQMDANGCKWAEMAKMCQD